MASKRKRSAKSQGTEELAVKKLTKPDFTRYEATDFEYIGNTETAPDGVLWQEIVNDCTTTSIHQRQRKHSPTVGDPVGIVYLPLHGYVAVAVGIVTARKGPLWSRRYKVAVDHVGVIYDRRSTWSSSSTIETEVERVRRKYDGGRHGKWACLDDDDEDALWIDGENVVRFKTISDADRDAMVARLGTGDPATQRAQLEREDETLYDAKRAQRKGLKWDWGNEWCDCECAVPNKWTCPRCTENKCRRCIEIGTCPQCDLDFCDSCLNDYYWGDRGNDNKHSDLCGDCAEACREEEGSDTASESD